jgi:DNA-binding CsgD family transcriptional regulator
MSCRAVHDKFGKYLGIRASVRDITKLKEALSHIRQLSEKRKLDTEMKHQLTGEIDAQEREISSYLMVLSQKNELIGYLEKSVAKLDGFNTQFRKKKIEEMLQKISQNSTADMDWEMFKIQFEKLYPAFFENIKEVHPNLTENDLRLCTFLRLKMSTKEIAGLLNISPKSIEVARVRLRKKLNIKREQKLKTYINNF